MHYLGKIMNIKNVLVVLLLFLVGCSGESSKSSKDARTPTVDQPVVTLDADLSDMLSAWSESFAQKIDSSYEAIVNFRLSDNPQESYHVEFKDKQFRMNQGESSSSNFSFESNLGHYSKMYNGEMTALTSMGQASSTDPIPLVPKLEKPVSDNLLNDFLFFSQRFFNVDSNDKVALTIDNSRFIHGGHAIPIFYQKSDEFGVRSAWYQINRGEQVNDFGDTNPFPQYFIITSGSGYAKIGRDTISINPNEAYFVAPENEHIFWNDNDQPLVLIFIAFGEGA